MLKVEFDKKPYEDEDGVMTVDVNLNDSHYGKIKFDKDQDVWVLWPLSIDDAVGYFKDLEETENTIREELEITED